MNMKPTRGLSYLSILFTLTDHFYEYCLSIFCLEIIFFLFLYLRESLTLCPRVGTEERRTATRLKSRLESRLMIFIWDAIPIRLGRLHNVRPRVARNSQATTRIRDCKSRVKLPLTAGP